MVLTRGEIINFIENINEDNLFSCGYKLSIGHVFEPGSGKELSGELSFLERITGKETGTFTELKIPPNGTAIIMTKEKVKLPNNVCATYYPTFELAQQGILLLNAASVQPSYEGYLSCFFVNMSSRDFFLYKDTRIAKILFHKLSSTPALDNSPIILEDENDYKKKIKELSRRFKPSFLDIDGIEDKVTDKAKRSVNRSIAFAGVFLTILIAFSTFEPIVSKYFWGTSPVYESRMDELQNRLKENMEISKNINEEQKILDSLNRARITGLKVLDSLDQVHFNKLKQASKQ